MASWLINCNECGHATDPGTIHKLALHCNEDDGLSVRNASSGAKSRIRSNKKKKVDPKNGIARAIPARIMRKLCGKT